MDAVYESRWKTLYHAECFVGLDPEFMVVSVLIINASSCKTLIEGYFPLCFA